MFIFLIYEARQGVELLPECKSYKTEIPTFFKDFAIEEESYFSSEIWWKRL